MRDGIGASHLPGQINGQRLQRMVVISSFALQGTRNDGILGSSEGSHLLETFCVGQLFFLRNSSVCR